MSFISLTIIALLVAQAAVPVTGAGPLDAGRVTAINAVIERTTSAWSGVFAAQGLTYHPPRITYVRVPRGHPGRGTGFHAGAGLVVDLGDVQSIGDVFGRDADALIALMIAHEIGHNVQAQIETRTGRLDGPAREQQADCYAGWWLAQTESTNLGYVIPDLDRRLPELFELLSGLSSGKSLGVHVPDSMSHGAYSDRVAAVRRGLAAANPAHCEVPPARE